MTISPAAAKLLKRLLEATPKATGLNFDGAVGSCRQSVPLITPAENISEGKTKKIVGDFTFFVVNDYLDVFDTATLDYEKGLFARGLNLTWPHRQGGCPNCRDH